MRIVDAWLGEHGVFYAQFDYLERALPGAGLERLRAQADLLAAALGTHARLEDELLFAALEEQLGPQPGPVAVMRAEHETIESALAGAASAADAEQGRRLLEQALEVARGHFAKEERILFPMAEQVLGDRALAQLGARWAQRRGVALSEAGSYA